MIKRYQLLLVSILVDLDSICYQFAKFWITNFKDGDYVITVRLRDFHKRLYIPISKSKHPQFWPSRFAKNTKKV